MGEHGLRVEGQVDAPAAAQAVVSIATARGGTKGVNSGQQRWMDISLRGHIGNCKCLIFMTLFIITEFATM